MSWVELLPLTDDKRTRRGGFGADVSSNRWTEAASTTAAEDRGQAVNPNAREESRCRLRVPRTRLGQPCRPGDVFIAGGTGPDPGPATPDGYRHSQAMPGIASVMSADGKVDHAQVGELLR